MFSEIKYATIKRHMLKVHNPEKPMERKPWIRHRRRKVSLPSLISDRKKVIKNRSRMSHAHLHGSMSLEEYLSCYQHIAIHEIPSIRDDLQPNSERKHFCCSMCNEPLESISHKKKHFEKKHDGKKFRCNNCEYLDKRLDNLAHHRFNRHGLATQGYEIEQCTEKDCNYTSVFPDRMALHKLSNHNIESERYETLNCHYGGCEHRTIDPKLLRVHIDGFHKNIKPPRPNCITSKSVESSVGVEKDTADKSKCDLPITNERSNFMGGCHFYLY